VKVNLADLRRRYGEIKDGALALFKREKLLPGDKHLSDDEGGRRRIPEPWENAGPDAKQILRQARRRQTNGLIILALLILLFLPPYLYFRLYASWLASFLLYPTFCLSAMWATASQRGDKLVLWLRRFHVRSM
jgi:hypothetical protein